MVTPDIDDTATDRIKVKIDTRAKGIKEIFPFLKKGNSTYPLFQSK